MESMDRSEKICHIADSSITMEIPIDQIDDSLNTMRSEDDVKANSKNIAESMSTIGAINPITVYKKADYEKYILASGDSRLGAMKLLGFKTCKAVVKPFKSESDVLINILHENLVRRDPNSFDVARSLYALKERLKVDKIKNTHNKLIEIAKLQDKFNANDLSKLFPLLKFDRKVYPVLSKIAEKYPSFLKQLNGIKDKSTIPVKWFEKVLEGMYSDDPLKKITVEILRDKIAECNGVERKSKTPNTLKGKQAKPSILKQKPPSTGILNNEGDNYDCEKSVLPKSRTINGAVLRDNIYCMWDKDIEKINCKIISKIQQKKAIQSKRDWQEVKKIGHLIVEIASAKLNQTDADLSVKAPKPDVDMDDVLSEAGNNEDLSSEEVMFENKGLMACDEE